MARVYLGHGASGTAATMAPWVDGLRARGIEAHAPDAPDVVVGGHSFGGRVASLSAAGPRRFLGLVCLSYPLHRPGAPETADARTAHWPRIACPALLLSGESDPFAKLGLLRSAVPRLPAGTLVTYPRLGHGLGPVRDDALDRIAAFVQELRPA